MKGQKILVHVFHLQELRLCDKIFRNIRNIIVNKSFLIYNRYTAFDEANQDEYGEPYGPFFE